MSHYYMHRAHSEHGKCHFTPDGARGDIVGDLVKGIKSMASSGDMDGIGDLAELIIRASRLDISFSYSIGDPVEYEGRTWRIKECTQHDCKDAVDVW